MSRKSHYGTLGVSRSESLEGIRQAYRKRAKECHPDRCGPRGTRQFQELSGAYEVLSDPDKRKDYDDRLKEQEKETTRVPVKSGTEGEARGGRPRTSSTDAFSFREKRWNRGFHGRQGPECLAGPVWELEIVLSPREARVGGVLPLRLPREEACPFCEGAGGFFLSWCPYCRGRGGASRPLHLEISIPAGIAHGSVLEAMVEAPRGRRGLLRLHVKIA